MAMAIQLTSAQLRRAADLQDKIESLQTELTRLLGAPVVAAPAAPAAPAPKPAVRTRCRRRRAAVKPVVKPASKPAAKPVEKPAPKPVAKPAAKSAKKAAIGGKARRLSKDSLAGDVREVLKASGKPMKIDAIVKALEAKGWKGFDKTARTNLGIQLYRMALVKKVGRGVFAYQA